MQGLIAALNPNNEPGRIVLIHRMGAKEIDKRLPALIQAVRATGSPVLWICDTMHGNTETATSGLKTRRFENIVSELEAAFRIHRELGSWLGGVHSHSYPGVFRARSLVLLCPWLIMIPMPDGRRVGTPTSGEKCRWLLPA